MHPDAVVLESRFAALDAIEQTAAGEARLWVHKADRLGQLIAITPGELHKGLPGEVGAALTVGKGSRGTCSTPPGSCAATPASAPPCSRRG